MLKIFIFLTFFSLSFANNTQNIDLKTFEKIKYLYNKTNINHKNPLFLNYIIISAYYFPKTKALKIYKKLKHNIPINEITSFGNMLDIFVTQYHFSFDFVYRTFLMLHKNLSSSQLKLLIEYPEALSLFFYKKNSKYQQLLITLYKKIYKKYKFHKNDKQNIIFIFNSLSLYVINQQQKINTYYFKKVFNFLIRNNFLSSLLTNKNICKNKKNFVIFSKNGIIRLIKFYKYNTKLFYQYAQYTNNLKALMFVVNVYSTFNKTDWQRFKNLFQTTTNNLFYNTIILSKLYKLGYFKMLHKINDADTFVYIDSKDISSIAAKKYKYILFTSIKSQNSGKNILYKIANNEHNIKKDLKFLLNKSPQELSKHLFTDKDKFIYYFNKVDFLITGISIALVVAPISANGLSYVLTNEIKEAGTTSLRLILKESIKKILTQNNVPNYNFNKQKELFNLQQNNKINSYNNIKITIGNILINNNYKPKQLCH